MCTSHLKLDHISTNLTLTSIGKVNVTVQRQAIILTNADLLSIGHLATNLSEIRIEIKHFSFMNMHVKISSVKC